MPFTWKIAAAAVLAGFLIGAVVIAIAEIRSIKAQGGLKKWVADVPTVNYRTVRATWLSEVVVVLFVAAILAHATWPDKVGELQVEAIYAIFVFLGTALGLNVAAFVGKRATANPEMVAATAAANQAPEVLPMVETTTTESRSGAQGQKDTSSTTTVTPVSAPTSGAPEALASFAPKDAAKEASTDAPKSDDPLYPPQKWPIPKSRPLKADD